MALKTNTELQRRIKKQRQQFNNVRVAIRQILTEHYGYECACCHKEGEVAVDHIQALAKDGRNDFNNFQLLCFECNTIKGDQTIDYRSEVDKDYKWPKFDYWALIALNKQIRGLK